MTSLYYTMILPLYLNYACEIWGNTSVFLQMQAIRLVDRENYWENSEPLFVKYNCLKLYDVVNLKTLINTY
jgi:hypothetical protein